MCVFVFFFPSYDNVLSGHDGGYSVGPIAPVDYFPSLMRIFPQMPDLANVYNHLANYQPTHYLEAHFNEQAEASL